MIDIEVDLADPFCFLTNMTGISAIASDVNAGVIFFTINYFDIEDNFKLYQYILGTDSATEIFSNSLNVTGRNRLLIICFNNLSMLAFILV